jgi:hypothetical protein
MEEQENPKLTITIDDIQEANQLSHSCPICTSPVENYVSDPALVAVICDKCGTLYHKVCWEQGGGVCAMIGCDSRRYKLYAQNNNPALSIRPGEITVAPNAPANRSGNSRSERLNNRRLKEQERQMYDEIYGRGLF